MAAGVGEWLMVEGERALCGHGLTENVAPGTSLKSSHHLQLSDEPYRHAEGPVPAFGLTPLDRDLLYDVSLPDVQCEWLPSRERLREQVVSIRPAVRSRFHLAVLHDVLRWSHSESESAVVHKFSSALSSSHLLSCRVRE